MRVVLKCVLPLLALVACREWSARRRDLGDLPVADRLLNSLYEICSPAGRQEPRLRERQQQQDAEDVPDGAARPSGAERATIAGPLVARIHPGGFRRFAIRPVVTSRASSSRNVNPFVCRRRRRSRSPSRNSPSSTRSASGSSTRRWIVRFNGRAPYIGSYPSLTRKPWPRRSARPGSSGPRAA